jgi:predicted PurR-regulated permease PerM
MANLTEKSTINLSLAKLITICVAIFVFALTSGKILEDFNKTASATEQNTKDVTDLKIINSKITQILENQQQQLDRLQNEE